MLLGIVIHASIPYFFPKGNPLWPVDDEQSLVLWVVYESIHVWRMPAFFLLAGFFAHLLLERRTTRAFIGNRIGRIAVPLIIFWPIMMAIVPAVWVYGWTSEFAFPTEQTDKPNTLGRLPIFHLWFLYYLLIQYTALLVSRTVGTGLTIARPLRRLGGRITFTRLPILLMVAAAVLQFAGGGKLSLAWWPISWAHFLYCSLFFLFGYGLHGRPHLLEQLKTPLVIGTLLTVGSLCFVIQLAFTALGFDAAVRGAMSLVPVFGAITALSTGLTATCWTICLVGIAERLLKNHSPVVRWLVDSSYWIYVMHLPVVAFLTFWLAHLDRHGRLREITGVEWSPVFKFLLATGLTLAIGLTTYQYFVRHTPINKLLNGHRARRMSQAKELP
tara:strand:+ start:1054 stop:2211 length:1158 start_codon:yes stop_codon:yes gene_type:complete